MVSDKDLDRKAELEAEYWEHKEKYQETYTRFRVLKASLAAIGKKIADGEKEILEIRERNRG